MKNYATNWTKNEFLTYLFIYCMNADFQEVNKEVAYIKARTSGGDFDKMHDEFNNDSDYTTLQKISDTHTRLGYTSSHTEALFENIKELFLSDGKFYTEEQNILRGLKHLLK